PPTPTLFPYTTLFRSYVPYHISSFVVPKPGEARLAYSVSTVENVDRVILVAEFLKKAAMLEGIPAEKLLVLGSPKLDAMVNVLIDRKSTRLNSSHVKM